MAAKSYKMFVDGKWVDASGGETFEDMNPYTGEVLEHFDYHSTFWSTVVHLHTTLLLPHDVGRIVNPLGVKGMGESGCTAGIRTS